MKPVIDVSPPRTITHKPNYAKRDMANAVSCSLPFSESELMVLAHDQERDERLRKENEHIQRRIQHIRSRNGASHLIWSLLHLRLCAAIDNRITWEVPHWYTKARELEQQRIQRENEVRSDG